MSQDIALADLQASIQDRAAFTTLTDYRVLGEAFLQFIAAAQPTRIVAPAQPHYIFYQYDSAHRNSITRPLNTQLFWEDATLFAPACQRFEQFLADLKTHEAAIVQRPGIQAYLATNEINRAIYTMQQAIGCVGDSLPNPNQSRKRIGQLFENLIALILQQLGLRCETRRIKVPLPNTPDYEMTYELDLVFSRNKAILTAEHAHLHPQEIVGSVKTTSKDRLDKIFLDKYMLTKLLGREVPIIAIFLHDVQRARRGQSIFGINSTFGSSAEQRGLKKRGSSVTL